MPTVYKTDGTKETLADSKLDTLQKAVGGYVTVQPHSKGFLFVVHEEGLLRSLPINPFYPQYVGNVVVVKTKEFK